MSEFECKVINGHPDAFSIWYRYVDDVIAKIKKEQEKGSLAILNSYNENIQFTSEPEKDQKIPFLDLELKREQETLKFGIFRKSTNTDIYINKNAFNPKPHKFAAFNFMLNRANRVPLDKKDYNEEIKKILQIARKNGFEEDEIHKINKEIKLKIEKENVSQLPKEEHEVKFRKFSYHPKFAPAFSRIFEKVNIKLCFNNRFNISQQFSKKIEEKKPEIEEKGIYQINCLDCDKSYIGLTNRSLRVRATEHRR